MTHKHPDPAFPDRPDHPDFWAMSQAVLALDELSERLTINQIVATYVDLDSAAYMAIQRALRAANDFGLPPERVAALAAVWVDGVLTGIAMDRMRT
jgi:hypothetical protein